MMTTNLTKRINESICAVGIPVLRRHRAQVTKRPWKRALSSASLCASLTIEAALSLTLFMFTVILLSVPMEILDTQRKVQTVLEVTGRELGWQVYRTSHTVHPAEMEAGKAAEAGEKGTGGWSELPSGLILQGYLKEKIQTAGGNKVSNIQCGASRVSEDGEWIDLRASYQVRLPFSVFALDHVTLTSRSRKRGWIGAEGGYFSEKNASEPEEKWVYVGRDSTRYHLSPSCHYIGYANLFSIIFSLSLKRVPEKANEVSALLIVGVSGGAVLPPEAEVIPEKIGQLRRGQCAGKAKPLACGALQG